MPEILNQLEAYDIEANRKSIYNDMEALEMKLLKDVSGLYSKQK